VLSYANSDQSAKQVSLLVGPEGGIAEEEARAAQAAGWETISLGPRILRAETAALTSIVLTMTYFNEL
jgi:16S rRNA (uracil1498-N3)-methyltransferase